jgi:hypothetical protein
MVLTEHRLEAYATLVFRTGERSPRAMLGAIAVHLEQRRDGVNVACVGFQPVFRSNADNAVRQSTMVASPRVPPASC